MARTRTRRRRPRGHIRQRGERSWEVKVELSPDPLTLQRRSHFCTVRGTRADAERQLTRLLHDIDDGAFTPPAKDTVADLLAEWLSQRTERSEIEESTLESYRHLVHDILLPRLGGAKITQISAPMIDGLVSDLLHGDARHPAPYAKGTIRKVHMILRGALRLAIRNGIIKQNPADAIELPRQRREEREVWTVAQAREFLALIAGDPLYPFFRTSVQLGTRRGELVGLCWNRVRFLPDGTGYIEVRQQIRLVGGKLQVARTKTKKSTRDIALPPFLVEMLQAHRARQLEQAKMYNWQVAEDSYVFTRNDGQPVRPDSVYHHFMKLIAKHGFPKITLHDLRHVFASLMEEAGNSARVKADVMGHTTTAMGDNVYTHTSDDAQRAAVFKAADAFESGFKAPLGGNFGGNAENGPPA